MSIHKQKFHKGQSGLTLLHLFIPFILTFLILLLGHGRRNRFYIVKDFKNLR